MGRRSFLTATAGVTAAAVAGVGVRPGQGWAASPAPARDPQRWEECLRLARELLLVGPRGEDLKLEYLKVLIDEGLTKTTRPKKVLVVGAGISGLVTGMLLKQAGHHVTIIEANANRIGGRIKTFRKGPEWTGRPPFFADHQQYAEAGAMRLPDFHPLALALVDKLGLKRRLFYNVDIKPGTGNEKAPVPPVVYRSFTGAEWRRGPQHTDFRPPTAASRTWIHTNGSKVRRADYATRPSDINSGFGLSGNDLALTAGRLLDTALDPVRDYFSVRSANGERVNKPVPEWIEGWARVLYDFDGYSMERFLTEQAKLSTGVVDLIGTLENLTSRLPLSFIHSFLTRSLVSASATYWEIEGGTANLPYALLPLVKNEVRMNRRMTRLEYWDPRRDCSGCAHVGANGPKVWIETVSETGGDDASSGKPGEREVFTGDVAIITVPFPVLRHVEVTPGFSYGKRRAVAELHYDSATKVLLEFNRRWWEFTEQDWHRELNAIKPGLYEHYRSQEKAEATGTVGGGSVTDGPNRFLYFPSHPVQGSRGGVVLASYSWADDANRWDSLDDADRSASAMRGLQAVYGRRVEAFFTGHAPTQSWLRNRYAGGEAAVFTPRQLTELQSSIPTPEGPVFFAGDHISLKHAWIEGSLETAVRAALDVNNLT
ncbi:monoamine oxidase [Streptoalloteichus hindustanus]|uniref:Monoamine oxidase n=2 Tax=Streptoalloteichus hindustanus TaxID=2017 RepID=A0A1M5CT68_STRHI|nr:monoamine oxidase [Streptoalloteichus hindustanus]